VARNFGQAGEAMTMNVNLSPQLEAMVKAKVASGLYTSASEVVREALRLMERQDQLKELQLEQLRQEIQNGLTSGEPMAWNPEAIKDEGRRLLQRSAESNHDA
jgi:antitoxin ParD1/3/4